MPIYELVGGARIVVVVGHGCRGTRLCGVCMGAALKGMLMRSSKIFWGRRWLDRRAELLGCYILLLLLFAVGGK